MTTREIFSGMESRLRADPSRLAGLDATYRFVVTGADGGTYTVKVEDGVPTVTDDAGTPAGCTITVDADDVKALVAGRLNPVSAFIGGKVQIQGDMGLAVKLQALLTGP